MNTARETQLPVSTSTANLPSSVGTTGQPIKSTSSDDALSSTATDAEPTPKSSSEAATSSETNVTPSSEPTSTKPASSSPTTVPNSNACIISKYQEVQACVESTKSTIIIQGPFTVPSNQVIDMRLRDNTTVILSGTVTFERATNLDGQSAGLMNVRGNGITFDSDPNNQGILYGNGEQYWDRLGGNGGVPKPFFFRVFATGNSVFKNIKLINSPAHVFSVLGSDILLDRITIDNSFGDNKGAHNTDGFDVVGEGIVIQNSWVHNQDDCLAINAASGKSVQFLNNTCIGGHGISIATYDGGVVENVVVKGCTVSKSTNGIRIKTTYGATKGHVSNILFEDVKFEDISWIGAMIQQDYKNSGSTGTALSKVPVTDVIFKNISGNMIPGKDAVGVKILCGEGNCQHLTYDNVDIRGAKSTCVGISPIPAGTGC
ncbi:putative extracellular polygalacturonase [Chytriomyces cf. hyalinus JEL632]|nr:putative extracellular polygalacturonase [Chytriomyces cf. hyalinus JEL632]